MRRFVISLLTLTCGLLVITSGQAQQGIAERAKDIKDTLVVLCLAGGAQSKFTAEGDLSLQAKIKDILSGKLGASGSGKSTFDKQIWEGVIGGISKDMTNIQSQQAAEARQCMVENGFPLVKRVLDEK